MDKVCISNTDAEQLSPNTRHGQVIITMILSCIAIATYYTSGVYKNI